MSGKSTYIRTLALMTVMAQIGCFVPANYASFPIVHQLFARVSTTDDLEANVSTFAAEMREMAFILRNIEARSMVIVDELGRGTSTTDGLAIAIAIAEALVESRALVWFVTHFHDLALIMGERAGVKNLHLAAEISPDASKMKMLYRITEGPVTNRSYGLSLAKLVDFPPAVLEIAHYVSEKLTQIAERQHGPSATLAVAKKRNLLLHLREQLLQARDGNMEGEMLRRWLKNLQDEFVLRMAAIDGEVVATPLPPPSAAGSTSSKSTTTTVSTVRLDDNRLSSPKQHQLDDEVMLVPIGPRRGNDQAHDDGEGEGGSTVELTDVTSPLAPNGHSAEDVDLLLSEDDCATTERYQSE